MQLSWSRELLATGNIARDGLTKVVSVYCGISVPCITDTDTTGIGIDTDTGIGIDPPLVNSINECHSKHKSIEQSV